MSDWVQKIEDTIEDELNNSDQCSHSIALPYGRIASELRKAKADGMREAAGFIEDAPRDRQLSQICNDIFLRASAIEKGTE